MVKGADLRRRLAGAIAVLLALAAAEGLYLAFRPSYVTTRSTLESAAPRLLSKYRDPVIATHGVGALCKPEREVKPLAFTHVCYFGPPTDRTLMFSTTIDYLYGKGVYYQPNDAAVVPEGVCTHHVFGRWWEFVSIRKTEPDCPRGFNRYTGMG